MTGLGYPDEILKGTLPQSCANREIPVDSPPPYQPEKIEIDTKSSILEINDRLYILLHGCYITLSGNDIIVKKKSKEIYRKLFDNYNMIYLQGFGQNVSVDFQVKLTEQNKTLVLAPPIGIPMTILNSATAKNSQLRIYQILRRNDNDVILTGLKIIAAKVMNQASVLKYFAKYRKKKNPDLGCELNGAADKIREIGKSIPLLDTCRANVRLTAMGLEGHAASIYWGNVRSIIPLEFGFSRRITKSAKDVINQCLNYSYGILYGEVWRAVVKAGLDPYFGLMHGAKRDQGSLVFDLIEEFRAPFADRLIIGMLGRGFLPGINKEGYLKTRVKKKIARGFSKKWFKKFKWRSKLISPERIMENQGKDLAKVFLKKGSYHAYKMRW